MSGLADRLERWARDCEDSLDADTDAPGVFLTNTLSGDFYDSLLEAAAELRRGEGPVSELRLVAKRNLRSMIERGSHDKATMLACLEELS